MLAWDDFKLVKAVADSRSLAGAADRLAVNTSTVFRRLGALEERLGARLFERHRSGYALTPAGEEMVGLAARMAEDVIAFERRIAGRDLKPSGELRVTTNDSFVAHVLMPIFDRFLKAYPDIRLDVIVANEALNLSKRDADVAIRASARPPENLVGRRLASLRWAVYGRQDVSLDGLDPFKDLAWVMPSESFNASPLVRTLREQIEPSRVSIQIDTVLGLVQAIESGIGIGCVPCFIGEKSPLLKRLPLPYEGEDAGLWILTHPDLRSSARVRAFLDVVGGELSKLKPLFECKVDAPPPVHVAAQ